jgi:hypothetical protein
MILLDVPAIFAKRRAQVEEAQAQRARLIAGSDASIGLPNPTTARATSRRPDGMLDVAAIYAKRRAVLEQARRRGMGM